jgi:hypothetical protein
MTTFKEIRGTAVQSVSSDPSNPESGQIWYNNSIGVLKGYQSLGAAAWAAGGNMGTAGRFSWHQQELKQQDLAMGGSTSFASPIRCLQNRRI